MTDLPRDASAAGGLANPDLFPLDRFGPFFEPEGDRLAPQPHAKSPWSPAMVHGRLFGGLVARAVEAEFGDPDFGYSRLTVDLFRPAPFQPLLVETSMVRRGNRIRLVEVRIIAGDLEVGRASVLMLRRGEHPPTGKVWSPPTWNVPDPAELGPPEGPGSPSAMPWQTRSVDGGGFFSAERTRMWHRETCPLVGAEPLSPLVRAGLAADLASPLSLSGETGLHFINADLTLYLQRLPTSDWIGFEAAAHLSGDGVAVGGCTLYDLTGPVGSSTVAGLANDRFRGRS